MDKIKLGTKIKTLRLALGLTQKQLAGDFMTRNMLSLIESGSALPSIESAEYIAERLNVSLSFLLSDGCENARTEQANAMEKIRQMYSKERYKECIQAIDELSANDFEANYIYAYSAFYYGKQLTESGALHEARIYLRAAIKKSAETVYDTTYVKTAAPLYLAIAENVQSPLLELDIEAYENRRLSAFDYEFYKYVVLDFDFNFSDPIYKLHIEAKALIKKYRFFDAVKLLREIEDTKNDGYNAFVFFGVYTDLENCYKQLGDFENAYRYSSKRIALINAFNN